MVSFFSGLQEVNASSDYPVACLILLHSLVGGNWNILQTNIVDSSILVTGPSSATSGNIPIFDGTTGKIIKDGGFLASTIARTVGDQSIAGVKTFNTFFSIMIYVVKF